MRKILITGDREWNNVEVMADVLSSLENPKEIILIHGDCRGADKMAALIGDELGMTIKPYPADWVRYRKGAGPIRNRQMVTENPDISEALAFHNNIEKSVGTKDMISVLIKNNITYRLITEIHVHERS
jgi:hypothetical protein